MTKPDAPRRRTFRERQRHQGWTGQFSASQPAAADRLVSLITRETQLVFAHAARISQITHHDRSTVYNLADGTVISAPAGARITWEEA